MNQPINTIPDDILEAQLAQWLPERRWFAAKGNTIAGVRILLRQPLAGMPGFTADHLLVSVDFESGPPQVYQVPLGFRSHLPDDLVPWALPAPEGSGEQEWFAYDGLHDAEVIDLYAERLASPQGSGPIRLRSAPGSVIESGLRGRTLGVEQSNTSVVLGDKLLMKIFRLVTPGTNPDVEMHRVLGEAGSEYVATLRAWIESDVGGIETTLAMVQDFAANSADGWTMALGSVRDLLMEADLRADEVGTDFAGESYRMGAAVAEVHATLAQALGTEDKAATSTTVAAMLRRLEAAGAIVPELAEVAPAVRERFAEAETLGSITVQRIHGDLHLGQVLRTPERWLLIDFEGEPAKTLAERREPDSSLRDVAGMLRSFDYAAHHLLADSVTEAAASQREFRAREWAHRNGTAFCEGYASVSGTDPRSSSVLLRAYELDKAVYEVVYEARNRPRWISLPLEAIRRLTA
ncbi:maltokinase N-terminal cap-like domain-containing protein [Rhodococcus tibetensis]|uniref:Maltokinase n=1 Tax=Rhodococcus tibetensis TaxID=2965064 RepID=A0ABT1QFA3_9NOCA|nr:phosphotransferase [Rhodococcus sp. FXJ9.536]MCQ4119770.1 phosphotransferase [Rhodococcus sp. FXJ9.536]